MKKLLFFLLAFLSVPAFAEVGDYTSFDFTKPKELNISPAIQSWDGSFDDQGVQVTSKVITSKDIQISFTLGIGQGGVYIPRKSVTIDGKTTYYYVLEMRRGSTIKIRTTNGCELDSVKFTGSTGSLTSSSTGLYYDKIKKWTPKTSTDTVVIENGAVDTGIQTIEVYYKKPSKPLSFVSSTPSAGGEVTTFNSMTLNFNLAIASSNANGITLSGPGIQSPVAMSASVRGTSVTLSTAKTYTAYGNYTVNVPAGAFKNSEGGTHDALSIPFKVNPKRDILTWQSVNPAQGTVDQLPEAIEVIYNEYVSVPANASVNVLKDGVKQFTAPVTLTEGNTKSVTVAHSRGVITDEGVWSFEFPEKTVYNGMMGNEADERWNPAFTLTYMVKKSEPPVPPVPPELEEAKQLKEKTDNGAYGYPVASSEGYTAIAAVVNKGQEATSDELKVAIGKYYKETNVKMLEAGKWYRIAGVNDSDIKAYLTYANQKVTLKSSCTSADAFQAVAGNGGIEFKTKDDRFLTVLGNPSGIGFENFTTPQSGKATLLTIAKLAVENYADSTKIIGKFTISGWLGRNANDEDLGNSTAAISYPSLAVVASPTTEIYFSSNTSSAFIFEETNEPSPTPCAQADVTFDNNSKGIEIEKAGDPIIIVVNNVQRAEIVNPLAPNFAKQNQIGEEDKITTTTPILSPISDSFYRFNVNTIGLEAGEYLLYIPAETFSYTPTSEYSCVDGTDAVLSITIKGSNPTLPDLTFDDNTKSKVIADTVKSVTLVVHNVQSADLANDPRAYLEKTGSAGRTPATLTKKANSSNEFNVSTSNLSAGEYSLYVTTASFSYIPTRDVSSIGETFEPLKLTINSAGPTPTLPVLTFDGDQRRKEIEAGTPITLVVHNVQSADIANASLPYFKNSADSIPATLTPKANSSNEFNVSTTGLKAGEYNLYVPTATFSYIPNNSTIGTFDPLSITVKDGNETYPFNAEVKMLMDPDVHFNVVADYWLNDIIFYTFDRSAIVPNPDAVITLTNINGATVRTGHLEKYPNYRKEMPFDWLSGSVALKLVLDTPFEKWELKDRAGTYFLMVPSGALGNGKGEINKETFFTFIVNDKILKTPSAELSGYSVEAGSSLILTIKNCGTVTLKDKSKAYYLERPGFSGKILKESVDNSFTVNTKGLEPGYYTLVLPAGTFKYDYPGYYVLDEEMSVSFSTIPLSIVGISSTEDDGIYYDLSGRKVNAPTKKGIYIKNGRKVVVK